LVIVSKVRGSIPISISLPSVNKRRGAGLVNIGMHKFVFGFKKNFIIGQDFEFWRLYKRIFWDTFKT
jgi:hypothetical protein